MQTCSITKNEWGFYQASPTPTKEELEKFYKDTYFQNGTKTNAYSKTYSDIELLYIKNVAVIAEKIWMDFSGRKSASLIDIGCGEGFFANYFFQKGWATTLCDFSSYGLESFHKDLLPLLIKGDIFDTLDELAQQNFKYDFINFAKVLEHVIDPVLALKKIKELMDEKSLLKIMVPNDFSKFQDLLFNEFFCRSFFTICNFYKIYSGT